MGMIVPAVPQLSTGERRAKIGRTIPLGGAFAADGAAS